ncbi:unnamed protein product, partial [Mesorhabditis belari]|uniref:Uncharacterized protein n=1 Tax=Mesorhabditis belari TaxID=2138241 RepID=A0AAF3FRJ5_9BILA
MVSSTTTSPRLTEEYDRDIIEEEIADASSNPADTWISPGNLIWGAYQKYLVQHGFLQPRGERELGGPKPKRRAIAKLNV